MANSKIHFIANNKEYQRETTMVQTWYYCTNTARTSNLPLLEHNTVSVALTNVSFMIAPPPCIYRSYHQILHNNGTHGIHSIVSAFIITVIVVVVATFSGNSCNYNHNKPCIDSIIPE